jgi:hypothetical protein
VKHAYAAVRADNAMVVYKRLGLADSIEHNTLCVFHVARINTFQERLIRAAELTRFEAVDPVKLVRPGHDVIGNIPFEAADVRDALCLL